MICPMEGCPLGDLRMRIEHDITCGPNDFFDISSNNSPEIDPATDDDEVIEPFDYAGDYETETDNHVDG